MRDSVLIALCALVGLSAASVIPAGPVEAGGFGPMNMVNPSRWFGNRYDDDDYYYRDRYGYPPAYYGAPYGAPGYGAPAYGVPGYGAPAYNPPAYAPAPAQPAPSDTGLADDSAARIKALEERIRQLESSQAPAAPKPVPAYQPSAPVFRPN